MLFALALHTEDGVQYGVTIPDLPGCFSAGETLDEALLLAREAIDAHCELLGEQGIELPLPRPLAQHLANPDLQGAVWAVIEVDAERYKRKSRSIWISVPTQLLRRIDAYVKSSGESRSDFFVRSALQVLGAP